MGAQCKPQIVIKVTTVQTNNTTQGGCKLKFFSTTILPPATLMICGHIAIRVQADQLWSVTLAKHVEYVTISKVKKSKQRTCPLYINILWLERDDVTNSLNLFVNILFTKLKASIF
jgi:hypothetical protein